MKRLKTSFFIILWLISFGFKPCLAFLWFKKKANKTEPSLLHLNKEVLIQKRYRGAGAENEEEIFDIKLAVHIPENLNELAISTFYDELNDHQIKAITWLVPGKSKARRIKAFKISKEVNQAIENYAINYNPVQAYDRISQDKHVINEKFFFVKDQIFPDLQKKTEHLLELEFSDGMKKAIRVEDYIYAEEIKLIPTSLRADQTKTTDDPYQGQYRYYKKTEQVEYQDLLEKMGQELEGTGLNNPSPEEEIPIF